MAASPYTNKANRYARGVVSGRTGAPASVRSSCSRHLADLDASKDKKYLYKFDRVKAERVCRFLENLQHVKGEWAGKPFRLEPWQCFMVCALFGWVRKDDGFRRFNTAYIQIPRKQGKSFLASGLALYMLVADGEPGAEVYSGATSEKQAWEVFRPAKQIAQKTPGFADFYGVEVNAKSIHVLETGSRFEPVIGKPGDGSSPHFWVVDEYHEHPDPVQYDTAKTGMGARSQPILLVITTAGTNLSGPCHDAYQTARKVVSGQLANDELFVFISEIEDPEKWQDFSQWKRVNLNLGVSVSEKFLRGQLRDAMQQASKQNINKTKHLNLWCNASTAWMNMSAWGKCADPDFDLSNFNGRSVWMGLDLASTSDLCALCLIFKDGDKYALSCRLYLPEAAAHGEENTHYQAWAHDGWITLTPGNVTDYAFIEADIIELAERFRVQEVAFDKFQATYLSTRLMDAGIEMIGIQQNTGSMSEPMKELEKAILSDNLTHDDNPVMNWMMSNVVAKADPRENILPMKDSHKNKIDGPVSAIMAIARAMHTTAGSVYDRREVRAL